MKYPTTKTPPTCLSVRSVSVGLILLLLTYSISGQSCSPEVCKNGNCGETGICECHHGWTGMSCDKAWTCEGRHLLTSETGVITDGPLNYTVSSKCMWLIQSNRTDEQATVIHVEFTQLDTECAWDNIYIFQGSSAYTPLVAALSGVRESLPWYGNSSTRGDKYLSVWLPSSSVYIYFISDAAYKSRGFNASYRIIACSAGFNLSQCNDIREPCLCDEVAATPLPPPQSCPKACSGRGTCVDGLCVCDQDSYGSDCSGRPGEDMWERLSTGGVPPSMSVSHAAVVSPDDGVMWVFGGETLGLRLPSRGQRSSRPLLRRLTLDTLLWEDIDPMTSLEASLLESATSFLPTANQSTNQTEDDNGTSSEQPAPSTRHAHSLVYHENLLYLYGGTVQQMTSMTSNELWVFNVSDSAWSLISSSPPPTTVAPATEFENETMATGTPAADQVITTSLDAVMLSADAGEDGKDIFMGGASARTTNEEASFKTGIAASGHTAHIIGQSMFVIFGHNPDLGYLSVVQEYDLVNDEWTFTDSLSDAVRGTYGHTSVYYNTTGLVYVYGGYPVYTKAKTVSNTVTDRLTSFNPVTKEWRYLTRSGFPSFLQSAVVIGESMFIYGGSPHNDSDFSSGAQCYSTQWLSYSFECDNWRRLSGPRLESAERYGHTAVAHQGKMFVYGGFDGFVLSDLLTFRVSPCSEATSVTSCLNGTRAELCVWDDATRLCTILTGAEGLCDTDLVLAESLCNGQKSCGDCQSAHRKCHWDDRFEKCVSCAGSIIEFVLCTRERKSCAKKCSMRLSCPLCEMDPYCSWDKYKTCSTAYNKNAQTDLLPTLSPVCPRPCHEKRTCEACTNSSCLWCASQRRCVNLDSYLTSFPFGQCLDWTALASVCPNAVCSELQSCRTCMKNPLCGWCSNDSYTGTGVCMSGEASGPLTTGDVRLIAGSLQCPSEKWHFTHCPVCQCHGHSNCTSAEDPSECSLCHDHTTGDHCDTCEAGYHGDPRNGGSCQACNCTSSSNRCDPSTGACQCFIRGTVGKYCDSCDKEHSGNPLQDQDCYYPISSDYRYTVTINSSSTYTDMRFHCQPPKEEDVEVEFRCTGGSEARVNISLFSGSTSRDGFTARIKREIVCDRADRKFKFPSSDYPTGSTHNSTFIVSVYNFTGPFVFVVTFSQYSELDLFLFFAFFFAVIMVLLIMAGLVWKLKMRYVLARRERRYVQERRARAKRPFSTLLVDLTPPLSSSASLGITRGGATAARGGALSYNSDGEGGAKAKMKLPSIISMEPLSSGKVGVVSVLVELPTGGRSDVGQSGMVIGSCLTRLSTKGQPVSPAPRVEYKGKVVLLKVNRTGYPQV